ncbi:MAG: hypothetical protein KDB79_12860 [Acidobacteria bacterium]|nr:hypothetical protein [Acidobacteriota bacterium]
MKLSKNKFQFALSLVLAVLSISLAASAQDGSTAAADPARELDFMLGNWSVEAKILTPQIGYITGTGTMKVTFDKKTLLAEMRIKFQNFETNGTTKRIYDPIKKGWNVSWNPVGQPIVPDIDGKMAEGRFIEIDHGRDNRGAYIGRLVIFDISKDKFSVRKDKIYDDGIIFPEIWMYEAVRIPDSR